jgi:transposase InsO family protein
LTEKQSGKYIKVLRSDPGGEYDSKEIVSYCKQDGIKRQFTTRYTPQHNGVVERKNQTIMNMAKSMLQTKNLSNEYRGEAAACSISILNLSPTNSVKNNVPREAWSGMKLSVSHFKVFGCVAYAHVLEELRKLVNISGLSSYAYVYHYLW